MTYCRNPLSRRRMRKRIRPCLAIRESKELLRATYELGVGKRNIIVKFAGGSHFLEVPDQKQPEVDGRRERLATHLGCVEIPETCLHESIEFANVQSLVETIVEGMPRRRRQVSQRYPQ